jgi:hypothetical protein
LWGDVYSLVFFSKVLPFFLVFAPAKNRFLDSYVVFRAELLPIRKEAACREGVSSSPARCAAIRENHSREPSLPRPLRDAWQVERIALAVLYISIV